MFYNFCVSVHVNYNNRIKLIKLKIFLIVIIWEHLLYTIYEDFKQYKAYIT